MSELRAQDDLAGRTYGRWTVGAEHRIIRHNRHWWCTCACGVAKFVKAQYLKGGESRQCSACGRRPRGYVDKLPLVSWNRLLTNAKKRGISIAITRDDAAALLDRQKDRCALSGLPIATRRDGTIAGDRATTASLDRIDSDKGYMPDNVQWVHKEINMMKGVLTQARFVELCRAVLDYQAQR